MAQLPKKKREKNNKKITRGSKETFLQRRHTDGQETHRCSTLLTIREMQIKTVMRYQPTPVRMPIIEKSANKGWRGCGGKGTLLRCW